MALLAALLLAGCSSTGRLPPAAPPVAAVPAPATPPADPARMQAVLTAMQMVGVPYRWGGTTPEGFDCSGLVQFVWRNAGIRLPRTAAEQLGATAPVTLEAAQPGDLLFFRDRGAISHVAIYIGEGRFVHAPRGGREVSLSSFDSDYYRSRFARAGQIPHAGGEPGS